MRIPALFALIALGTFSPAARWAAASSTAHGANSGPAATVHQSSAANVPRGVAAKDLSSARSPSIRASRTVSNRGHFTPRASNTGAALGASGNAVGGHARAAHSIAAQAFAAPVLGGRAPYDAKKGAVIGGPAISHKR